MSILIKGMEMPSCCYDCTFSAWSNLHRTKACKCGSHYYEPCFEDYSREFYEKRADFCPLVEVPVPHGRLIDADALIARMESDAEQMEEPIAQMFTYAAINDVKHSETVIEAEDGDTE